jgi:hypothetical protein
MWSDENVNATQQRIIRRHLRFHFGKRLFMAEKKIQEDVKYYQVPTTFGSFKYYKDGGKSQKAEKCSYWSRDASLVVSKELERVLDYTKDYNVISRFSSLASSGLTIVAGADQGQGAWRSWIKINTMSGIEICDRMGNNDTFDPKSTYRTIRDFYSPVNFFAYVAWYKIVAKKIKSLKFDVGYIELCSQPIQLLTQ